MMIFIAPRRFEKPKIPLNIIRKQETSSIPLASCCGAKSEIPQLLLHGRFFRVHGSFLAHRLVVEGEFVFGGLTDGQGDALLLGVNAQHLHADNLTFLHGVSDLRDAVLRALGDVHQAIQTGLEFNERAEVRNTDDLAFDDAAFRIALGSVIPRTGLELLVTKLDAFTFAVEGVSRALLAQLTRHRIASFSVQSQRYVSMAKGFDYVIPPAIEALGESEKQEFIRQMDTIHEWYCHWQEKLGGAKESANEDARFVLPNAASTRLLVTMNARELMHFFSLRCCNRAQWEIREMAWQMLTLCKQAAPALFEHAGPACVSGACPEEKNTCGKMAEVREKAKSL